MPWALVEGPPLPDLKMEHWEEEILSHIKLTAVGLPPVFDDDNLDGTQVIEIIGGLDPLSNPVAVEPSAFETYEFTLRVYTLYFDLQKPKLLLPETKLFKTSVKLRLPKLPLLEGTSIMKKDYFCQL
ncbi:hypothetical protein ACJJTC_003786 [Scirpophaga incertulas]